MTNEEIQNKIDIEKWVASEKANRDLCGEYEYCKNCNKELEFPCAKAINITKPKRVILSFNEKLAKAKIETVNVYNEIVEYTINLNVKSRVTKKCHTFRIKNKLALKITLTKNSLKVILPLDPKSKKYDGIKHIDLSNKKEYQKTPFAIQLNTKKAINSAKELIAIVIKNMTK